VRLCVYFNVEFPDEIGDLIALRELSSFGIYSTKLAEALRRLRNLKSLEMNMPSREQLGHDMGRYEQALKLSLTVIGNHGLQSLMIRDVNHILREEYFDLLSSNAPCLRKLDVYGLGIPCVPKQMASFVDLTYLKLDVRRVKQEDLCMIGGLPALLYCQLSGMQSPNERITISSEQFQCLKEFCFCCSAYRGGGGLEMMFLQDAMPELRRLVLGFKAQETESKMGFEFSFEHLASLEHIRVGILTDGATRSRVEAAKAAVRSAVSMHPGRPTLDMSCMGPPPKDEADDSRQV
jgi:hypothetical protein